MVKIICDFCGKEIDGKKENGLFSEIKFKQSQYEREKTFHLHIGCAVRLKNEVSALVKKDEKDENA